MQGGKLGDHGFAHEDSAGRPRLSYAGGVRRRLVTAINRRTLFGQQVEGIDDVFDAQRHANQSAAPVAGIQISRAGDDGVGVYSLQRADLRFARGNLIETVARNRFARDGTALNCGNHRWQETVMQGRCIHAAIRRAAAPSTRGGRYLTRLRCARRQAWWYAAIRACISCRRTGASGAW